MITNLSSWATIESCLKNKMLKIWKRDVYFPFRPQSTLLASLQELTFVVTEMTDAVSETEEASGVSLWFG